MHLAGIWKVGCIDERCFRGNGKGTFWYGSRFDIEETGTLLKWLDIIVRDSIFIYPNSLETLFLIDIVATIIHDDGSPDAIPFLPFRS